METLRVIFVAVGLLAGGIACGHAHVRSYEKLSLDEKIALQDSEQRVANYDQQLANLDRARLHHRISAADYDWDSKQLVFCIRGESLFQNAILVRESDLPQRARDVLETMEHGVLMVPVGVGYVVAACPQVLSFLTCIH
jgi:hypothetical protein